MLLRFGIAFWLCLSILFVNCLCMSPIKLDLPSQVWHLQKSLLVSSYYRMIFLFDFYGFWELEAFCSRWEYRQRYANKISSNRWKALELQCGN
jgi:hypothetical protein